MKMRWFLIGVIVTVFFGDWLRMRVERAQLLHDSIQASELAEDSLRSVSSCNQTLASVKDMLSSLELRSQIALLTRAQALDLFTRSKKGDPQAKELMRELGLDPDAHADPFEANLGQSKLAMRRK